MKTILLYLFSLSLALGQAGSMHLPAVPNIAALKTKAVSAGDAAYVLSKTTIGDNLGAIYYWDASSSAAEDLTNLNVIASSVSATGRWVRNIVRTQSLPGGMLAMNGGKKEYFVTATTDSNGQVIINLTLDNTSGGTAIFSDIRLISAQMSSSVTNSNDATNFYVKAQSGNVVTLQFFKANQQVLGLLGITLAPFVNVASGIVQKIKIEGF